MMSEKKIKVGDRVRFIGDSGPWFEHQITNGDEGTVVGKGICNDDVCVSFPIADIVDIEDLEMIEPTDPRSAFLQELKELLAKYDAEILAVKWSKDATTIKPLLQIDVDGHKQKPLVWENTLHNEYAYLNADNIMDYKK